MQIDLNYPEPAPVSLEPAKTMLLIVDMENEDAHPTGKRYMGEAVEQIIPKIAGLRRRVRQAGGLVVHTQSVRKPDALEFTLFKNVVYSPKCPHPSREVRIEVAVENGVSDRLIPVAASVVNHVERKR